MSTNKGAENNLKTFPVPGQSPLPSGTGHASARGESPARLSISTSLARERVRILLGICRAIDGHVAAGHPALPQFRKFARRYAGAVYRCEPPRPLKLSAITLRRIYYCRWLRSGRKPEALHHRYGQNAPRLVLRPGQRRLLPGLLRDCDSLAAVFRALYATAKRPPSHYVFRRTFTADERQFVCRMFAERRQAAARERQAQRQFRAWVSSPARSFTTRGGQS